jgi:hypothetical protein
MPLLVRRINRAKWEQINSETDNDVSADAITNCLKTTNNDLSVWKIEKKEDLENAILALITGKSQAKLSTLHYVILSEDLILEKGLDLSETEGDTIVEGLKKTHNDISNLTYKKLGIVKDIILDSIKDEQFFSKRQLKDLIKSAIEDGKIEKQNLNAEFLINEKL